MIRRAVEDACAAGLDLAIVSGTHLENVDDQLRARPAGPGSLVLLLNRGSEVFVVDRDGPQLVSRRTASPAEDAALTRAAELTVARLAARGLRTEIVSQRLNRRKIDLIPEPAWADPPKARIGELLEAVERRLGVAGIIGLLPEVVAMATAAATEAGLDAPKVTSDAKHVEIGLTDKADSAGWVMAELWRRGIAPGQVLIAGDELGPLGGLPGSDFMLLSGTGAEATAVSVGQEPHGVPAPVIHIGGGPARFLELLADQIRRRRARALPIRVASVGWTLEFEDGDSLLERVRESLLTTADGRVGTRASRVVPVAASDPQVVCAGIFTGSGPETRLLPAPLWNVLDPDPQPRGSARRSLDLHSGVLRQEIGDGLPKLDVLLFSSFARPGTAVLRARARGRRLRESPGPVAPPGAEPEAGVADGAAWMAVGGSPGSIVAGQRDTHQRERDVDMLDRVATYAGATEGCPDRRRMLASLRDAQRAGVDGLLSEHRRAWGERWDDADVVIEGDPEMQLAARVALFHLMGSVATDGEAPVGARGLSGAAYRGHVFWDSDVFVLPFLAATHPAAARAMLEYRLHRLPAALRAAKEQRRGGARFPWESAHGGEDVTPETAVNRLGERVGIRTGALEEHIVADVAWAAACYCEWTGDEAFARGPGRELLVQTARWWASRIELDGDGSGHIRGVIGPDEYHEAVDDNAFTNVMARWNLRRAAAAAADGHEAAGWRDLADALVDGFDEQTGVYEQFRGFFGLEPLRIADVAPHRPVAADVLLGTERTRGAQVVKQADVLMLHYLLDDEVAPSSLEPSLDFYEPRTAHGSSLSPGVHAALLARAGRLDAAVELLRLAARIDLDDIGQTTAGGLHLAAMGTVWRTLAFGFVGLRPMGHSLALDPVLPSSWEALELRLRFRGSRLRVRVTHDGTELSAEPAVAVLPPGATTPVQVSRTPYRLPRTTAPKEVPA